MTENLLVDYAAGTRHSAVLTRSTVRASDSPIYCSLCAPSRGVIAAAFGLGKASLPLN
jgi:hypothetical protein